MSDSQIVDPTPQTGGRPDPEWVRGKCPECGDDLVSHLSYQSGEGYVLAWVCWGSQCDPPTCTYKKVL